MFLILFTIVIVCLIFTTKHLLRILFDLPKYIKMMFPIEVENLEAFLQENKSHEVKICSINGLSLAGPRIPFPVGYLTIKDNSIIITWVSKNNNRQVEITDFSFVKLIAKHGMAPNLAKIGDTERNCEIIVSDDVFSLIQDKLN